MELEVLMIRRFYSDIQHAITDPIAVASLLHQEDVVGEVLLDEVSPTNKVSHPEKTASIMRHVEAAIRVDPKSFWVFLSVLDQFTPSYKVARRMKQAVDLHASAAERKGTLASSQSSEDEVTVSVVYKEDFDAIEMEFVSLHLRASHIILKKGSVTLQELKELLSFYPQLEIPIRNAENVTEVMQALQRHSSFINCSYLKHVAGYFRLPEVTREIDNYNKLVDDFCNRKIIQHSYMKRFTTNPPQYNMSSQIIKIKIMLEWNPASKTLSDIRSLLRKAFKSLSPHIHVDVIGEGSVIVVCYAPYYIMDALVKMAEENKSMLLGNSVSYLSIGYTVVLDSIAAEKEEARVSDLKQENALLQLTLQDQCKEPQSQLSQLVEKKSDNEAKLQPISLADIDEVWSLPRTIDSGVGSEVSSRFGSSTASSFSITSSSNRAISDYQSSQLLIPPDDKNPLFLIPENKGVIPDQDKETSNELDGSPRPIHPRTRSLPAADFRRPGAKYLRQRRRDKAITFTSCVDRGLSNLTTIKDEQSQSEYECKPMTRIFSPTSTSKLELLNQTKKIDTGSQTMSTGFDEFTPAEGTIKDDTSDLTQAEKTIKDAIREHAHQFSKYMNLTQLVMHLEKHMLLDKDSRSKLFDFNSTVPIALRPHYFLFEVLPSKGPSAYTLFLRALEEEQEHFGHKELVGLIRKHSIPWL